MRLLQLHDDAPDGACLELHPRMTVVTGLSGPARERVLAALAALPGGRGVEALDHVSGTVESTGILLDLDPATLALLDLTSDLDPVVRPTDIDHLGVGPLGTPAAAPAPTVTLDQARQAQRNITATHDALRQSLEALEEAHRRILARRSVLASALVDLGAPPPVSNIPAAPERSAAAHQAEPTDRSVARSATVVLDGPGPTPEAVAALASAAARVDRLRTRRDETVAALEPFGDLETADVEAALAEAQGLRRTGGHVDPEAAALADELVAAMAALDAYDAALEAAGHGPVAAYKRLDEAQRWLLAADAAVKPPVIDPEEARALEAAHDEVQAAEQKLTGSRMPSKAVKKRLDDAVEVEQQVLARMGFATYTSFVMSTTVPLVSPELRAQHDQAQAAFVAAEEAFIEAGAVLEQDPQRNAILAAIDQACERAHAVVGRLDLSELEGALRGHTVVDQGQADEVDAATDRLRDALQGAGVDFGDLELEAEEVAEVAAVWLADMAEAAARRTELEAELARIEDEIAAAELELADVDTAAPSVIDRLDDPPAPESGGGDPDGWGGPAGPFSLEQALGLPVDGAGDDPSHAGAADAADGPDVSDGAEEDDGTRADLEEALAEVDAEVFELEEQIDAQGALVAAAAAGVAGAGAQVQTLEAAGLDPVGGDAWEGELAAAGLDGPPTVSGVEQIEWYLLSRLAAQRSVSYAGSVPLVLDDALSRLGDEDVDYLLDRLLRMTDAVQVVYVGDDPRVVGWGRAMGDGVDVVVAA